MTEEIKLFLQYGIYNNTLYYPNTFKTTKQYIQFLNPLIKNIKKIDKQELLEYITNNNINIYGLSLCVSILDLNKKTYQIILNKISSNKEILIFIWIYAIITNNKRSSYLNKLLVEEAILVKNNIPEIFKIYTPSHNTCLKINAMLRKKYKIRYMIESQEKLSSVLPMIKSLNIKPLDIYIEMGFTFNPIIKDSIIEYFLNNRNNNLIELIHFIDRWYISDIPNNVLIKIKERLMELKNLNDLYLLFVLNTALEHKELCTEIEEFMLNFKMKEKILSININYTPNMNLNTKWDGLHSYNGYAASLICLFDIVFKSQINLRDSEILGNTMLDKYNELLNYSSFSLEKGLPIARSDILSVLFSNDMIDGYDILWNVVESACPLYQKNDYLNIIGKNVYLIESFLKYIYSLNNKSFEFYEEQFKMKKNKENTFIEDNDNLDNFSLKDKFLDSVEDTIDIAKDGISNIKFKINKK